MKNVQDLQLRMPNTSNTLAINDSSICQNLAGQTMSCTTTGAVAAPTVEAYGGSAADTFDVYGVGAATAIHGGGGADTVTVKSTSAGLGSLLSRLTVDGNTTVFTRVTGVKDTDPDPTGLVQHFLTTPLVIVPTGTPKSISSSGNTTSARQVTIPSIGTSFTLAVGGAEYFSTLTDLTPADVAADFAAQLNTSPSFRALASGATLTIVALTPQPFDVTLAKNAGTLQYSVSTPSTGDVIRITLGTSANPTLYGTIIVTVGANPTADSVATQIAQAANVIPGFIAVAAGAVVDISRLDGAFIAGPSTTGTTGLVRASLPGIAVEALALPGASSGDEWVVTLTDRGKIGAVTHDFGATTSAAAAASALAADFSGPNGLGGFAAMSSGSLLILTRTVSPNGFGITLPALDPPALSAAVVAPSAAVAPGEVWSISVTPNGGNAVTTSVTASQGTTLDNILGSFQGTLSAGLPGFKVFNAGGVLAMSSATAFTLSETTTFYYEAEFDPILRSNCAASCPNGSSIDVRSVVLDALGTPVQTLVQEKGVPEFGLQMNGKQKTDLNGNPVFLDAFEQETTDLTKGVVPVILAVGSNTTGAKSVWYDSQHRFVFDSSLTGLPVIIGATSTTGQAVYVTPTFDRVFSPTGPELVTNGSFGEFVPNNGTAAGWSSLNIASTGGCSCGWFLLKGTSSATAVPTLT
ncbi:MAG TPA: hypothetical protein VKJ07_05495, partial [Mycobacteriales bacterium]|nr:hypothetical protein [Mycobacteriales bacterium]